MMHGSGNLVRGGGHMIYGFGPGFMANGSSGWLGWLPLACHLIFMLIVIVLAIVIWKRHAKKVLAIHKQNDPALLVLRERYAQGEIDSEEFKRRREDLAI